MAKAPFHVLYEDNHLLVVNKSAGILVQGDSSGDATLLDFGKRYVKEKYNKPGDVFLGLVHRIDRPVSGVVVLARTSKALERMNALFRGRETIKIYWAIVRNKPSLPEGSLTHWLKKDELRNKTTAYNKEVAGSLKAELNYKLIAMKSDYYLLQVNPITGRPHQIRVQLSMMGCVIVGDVKYGDDSANQDGSICLHARSLAFVHPVKKEKVTVTAPLPDIGLWKNFSNLAS